MVNLMIQTRQLVEVNTDPQRRCYNGVHAKSEWQWTSWRNLEPISEERKDKRLEFWRDLSVYAVSQRGKSGMSEYRTIPIEESRRTKYYGDNS